MQAPRHVANSTIKRVAIGTGPFLNASRPNGLGGPFASNDHVALGSHAIFGKIRSINCNFPNDSVAIDAGKRQAVFLTASASMA
jgi:hypothetical protein